MTRRPGSRDSRWRAMREVRSLALGALLVVIAAACVDPDPSTLTRRSPQPEAGSSARFFALWPEHNLGAAVQAQGRADDGWYHWRLDPVATAERFARDGLGWDEAIVRTCPFEQEPNCGAGDTSRPNTSFLWLSRRWGSSDLIVKLDRLVRPGKGGVWSVSWVGGAGEDLPAAFERPPGIEEDPTADISPGAEIPAGGTIFLRSSRPDAEGVVAGYVYWGPCRTEGFGSSVRKVSVFVEFQVATRDVTDACATERRKTGSMLTRPVDGVIFAATLRPSGMVDPARLGVWLFDSSRRTLETARTLDRIVNVAAMPVRFVSSVTPAEDGLG